MVVIYSEECLKYGVLAHPESPERVSSIYTRLKQHKNYHFVSAIKATRKDLLTIHSPHLVESVRENTFADSDTPNIDRIYHFSRLAAGGALQAAEITLTGKNAFSLMRPPGHHATIDRVGGFCYFNNVAVGAVYLLNKGKKVAILDVDVHHGNGTENIFMGKKGVIFCSLHQVPLYPGTGFHTQQNCYNFPLRPGDNWQQYESKLSDAMTRINSFNGDVLAVSLGFDTYRGDPLAGINLEIKDYKRMGKQIRSMEIPTFFVLEGGYSQDIGILAENFFAGFNQS